MSEKDQCTSNILLAYEFSTKGYRETSNVKITVYLNLSSEGLWCLNCDVPIEEGMPIVKERIEFSTRRVSTFDRHLSCFSAATERVSRLEVGRTKIQEFIGENPDLLVLERLRGVEQ